MVSQRVNNGWLTLNILSPDGLHCFLWCVRHWSNWGWHACWWQKYLMLEMRSGTKSTYPCFCFVYIFLSIFLTDAWFCTKPPIKHYQPLLVFFVQYCSCSLHGGHWMPLQVINMNLVFNIMVQLTWVLMIWHPNNRFAAGKWHVPIKDWKNWWEKMTKELFWSMYFIEIHVATCGL